MRSRQQNVRQRAASKQLGTDIQRGSAQTSWEIASDGGYESTSSGNNVPMNNPLHFSNERGDIPTPPGSFPLTWRQHEKSNTNHAFVQAPSNLDGPNNSQSPSLASAMIPDSSYQAYLLGKRKKKKRNSFIDKICFAKFCATFSWIAIVFFVFIGILIDTQPLFIQGVLDRHEEYGENQKVQVFYDLSQSERLPAASHAYQAAFFYFLIGCASLAYAYNLHWWFKTRKWQYRDIPDAESKTPTFHANSGESELPTSSPAMKAYQYDYGVGSRIWNVTRVTANRVGIYVASIWPRYQEKRRTRRRHIGAKDV